MKDVHVLQKAGVYQRSLKIEESFTIFYNLANSCEMSRTVVVFIYLFVFFW